MYITDGLENDILRITGSLDFVRVAVYRCKTWSPTLRAEHKLRVFENRVLRRIF
jgi:hypothetical protein